MIPLFIIGCYLLLLLGLGLASNHFFRGTSKDYFVASHSIGPFMLLMSIFGTTMTAFALVGSTGKAYTSGISVYGLMASWSGLVHSACFFLIGVWAAGQGLKVVPNAVLGKMVADLVHSPYLTGLLIAGVLAAIMSSLDSQFMCLGTMFTKDVVAHHFGSNRFTDGQTIWLARGFIVFIVAVSYALSLFPRPQIFDLGVWCFSGFSGLFPLVFAALYWRRTTRAGATASVLVTMITWIVLFTRDMAAKGSSGGGDELLVFGMMPVAFIVVISLITLVGVSVLTQPPTPATVNKFFPEALKGLPH